MKPPGARLALSRPSLRGRLMLLGILALLVSLGGLGIALDRAFSAATISAIDERLENIVLLLLAHIDPEQPRLGFESPPRDERLSQPESGLFAGIAAAEWQWQSPSALLHGAPPIAPAPLGSGVFAGPLPDRPWFSYTLNVAFETETGEEIPLVVWAAQAKVEYDRQMASYRRGLWPYLAGAAAVVSLMQYLGLALGMRPFHRVLAEIKAVERGASDALGDDYPSELEPLTVNINALLATERANRERYRRALDDLAHSLKTPLAVARQVFDSARPGGADGGGAEWQVAGQALDDMQQTIGRHLERAGAVARRTHAPEIEVWPLARRLVTALGRVYGPRGVGLECDIPAGVKLRCEERDLMEILGNLLENACKYGRSRARITARVAARNGLEIVVEDDGPGIAADDFSRFLERGTRGDRRAEGQGLGLALAAELAAAYRAVLTLDRSPLGGAALHLVFPA